MVLWHECALLNCYRRIFMRSNPSECLTMNLYPSFRKKKEPSIKMCVFRSFTSFSPMYFEVPISVRLGWQPSVRVSSFIFSIPKRLEWLVFCIEHAYTNTHTHTLCPKYHYVPKLNNRTYGLIISYWWTAWIDIIQTVMIFITVNKATDLKTC